MTLFRGEHGAENGTGLGLRAYSVQKKHAERNR